MAIFLDTSFYLGLLDPKDEYYLRSLEILKDLKKGIYGIIYTSNLIMAESATFVAIRTNKNLKALKTMEDFFIGSEQIASILRVNEKIENDSWEIFHKINADKKNKVISFVDCTNIIICKNYSIENILSFDNHFDGWVSRIY